MNDGFVNTDQLAADHILTACSTGETKGSTAGHFYCISPVLNPVSFWAQQNRALNLAWALMTKGELEGKSVAVIGGGLAGVTTALALQAIRCIPTIYEWRPSVLHRQSVGEPIILSITPKPRKCLREGSSLGPKARSIGSKPIGRAEAGNDWPSPS